ncbi:uncharacterized protein METZ01_LOCUS238808, partial [marine metagenome]
YPQGAGLGQAEGPAGHRSVHRAQRQTGDVPGQNPPQRRRCQSHGRGRRGCHPQQI